MSDLSVVSIFQGKEIRFVGTAEKPEWIGADVVNVLYPSAVQNKNQSTYLSRIPDEWKGSKSVATPGGRQEMTTIYEPGLYALIVRSESPLAVPFQKWVFEEVLPSIRKTGSYNTSQPERTAELENEIERMRLDAVFLAHLNSERRQATWLIMNQEVEELRDRVLRLESLTGHPKARNYPNKLTAHLAEHAEDDALLSATIEQLQNLAIQRGHITAREAAMNSAQLKKLASLKHMKASDLANNLFHDLEAKERGQRIKRGRTTIYVPVSRPTND